MRRTACERPPHSMPPTGGSWGCVTTWALRGQVRGLITFQTDAAAEAERLVAHDPFLGEGLLERHWVKEWLLD
jgi:hypothetical protein